MSSLIKLQIINLALGHSGMTSITQAQLTANELPSAIAANLYWDVCQDEVLGEVPWSFATNTLALSSLNVRDIIWSYCYSYPTVSVGSMWNVFNEATTVTKEEQEFEVKYISSLAVSAIYTNLQYAYGEFSYRVTDTTIWSTKFVMAFSYKLASSMTMSISGDVTKATALSDIYNNLIGEAKRIGNSEKRKVPNVSSSYQDGR